MTADLLRQLDAYGDQLEAGIDHITAEEVTTGGTTTGDTERAESRNTGRPRRRYRLVAGLGFAAVVLLVGVGLFGTSATDNFSLISADLDAGSPTTTQTGDRTPRTTLFSDAGGGASLRPQATQAPATTAAPLATTTTVTTRPPRVATTTAAPQQTATTTAPPSQTTPPSLQGRDIVFVGTMVVAVTDSAASADEVRRIAESFGGFVAQSQTTTRNGGQSIMTIRVLPSTFQTVLDRIGELGFVRSEQVTSDDVTEVVVDLESQIVTAEVSVERLRTLLENASGLEQITRLERELLQRERELERLRGQLRTVEDQVGLATISVTLTESIGNPAIDLSASRYVSNDGGASCPSSGGRPTVGDEVAVCLVVINVGDVPLVDVTIGGDGVASVASGLSVVRGDLDRLEPGDTALVVGTTTAATPVTATFTVTGTPVGDAGTPVPARNVSEERRLSWNPRPVPEPPEEPEPDTVITALQDGWDAFTDIGGRTLRVLAYAAPFLVFIGAVAWLVWWRRRRYWQRLDRTMGAGSPEAAAGSDTDPTG